MITVPRNSGRNFFCFVLRPITVPRNRTFGGQKFFASCCGGSPSSMNRTFDDSIFLLRVAANHSPSISHFRRFQFFASCCGRSLSSRNLTFEVLIFFASCCGQSPSSRGSQFEGYKNVAAIFSFCFVLRMITVPLKSRKFPPIVSSNHRQTKTWPKLGKHPGLILDKLPPTHQQFRSAS